MKKQNKKPKSFDKIRKLHHLPDGTSHALRISGDETQHTISLAIMTPADGRPQPENSEPLICSEPDSDGWADIKPSEEESAGPAMVNNQKFRSGWDRIFSTKRSRELLN